MRGINKIRTLMRRVPLFEKSGAADAQMAGVCRGTDYRAFFVVLALAALTSVSAAVKVVESTPSRLVLSWELPALDTVSVPFNSGGSHNTVLRTRLSFHGGYILTGDSGAALIPAHTFYAGVPSRGNVRVSVEPEDVAVMRLNHPLLRRDFARDTLDPVFTASPWISDPAYTSMRGYRTAYLALRPVYDMGHGSVRILRRARIVIEFPAAAHSGASWEPRGDYERMISRLILNYRTAQGWRERPGLRKSAFERDPYPFRPSEKRLASFRVGDGNRDNNETSTKENALIRISGRRVRELFDGGAGSIPVASVALYASHRGEMDLIPANEGEIPPGVFEVPILRYDLGGDGYVDNEDYFIAYVSGASDWTYTQSLNQGEFAIDINRYDDRRTYWLTVKDGVGLNMEKFVQPVFTNGAVPEARGYFEDNLYLRTPQVLSESSAEGGLNWAWRRFTVNRPDTAVAFELPGVDTTHPISVRLARGRFWQSTGVNMFLGADTVCTNCGNNAWSNVKLRGTGRQNAVIRLFTTASDTRSVYYELNGMHIKYRRALSVTPSAGKLEVFSSVDDGAGRYRLKSDANTLAYVVRVPLDEREISLVDTVRANEYVFGDTGNLGVRYMVALESSIVDYSDSLTISSPRPLVNSGYRIRDLRGASNRTDYLIVTHENFIDAAMKLSEHKKTTMAAFDNPRVVTIGDVMGQFGGGNTDPVALRNFLLYVYRHWDGGADLSYVVLVGTGHYDYKHIASPAPNFMPVMYIESRLGDDYYTFFDTTHPSTQHDSYYFIGRLPAKSAAEAQIMVDKIIETEAPRTAEFDVWRNRVLLTADDDQQGEHPDRITNHVPASEEVAGILMKNRPGTDLRKIYLFEYPWDDGYNKPTARRALINEINSGVAVVNWFGHGSVNQLADELLFAKGDLPALSNRKRYPLFSLFSCSIGKYDMPGEESLGSMLVGRSGSGAIAVMSSVRDVLAAHNRNLAIPFFTALFDADENYSFGAALRYAKSSLRDSDNRLYALLGDPSIVLTPRNLSVSVKITDTAGIKIDTLKALQQITIKGNAAPAGAALARRAATNDSAYVSLTLFNPPENTRRKDGGQLSNPEYSLPGSPVFSARVRFKKDEGFEQRITLPMNLALGKPGVMLSAYVWENNAALSGTGFVGDLIFLGSEIAMITDTTPPKISIRPIFDDESMNAGMFVRNRVTAQLPLTLEVKIEDESGINTMGAGPDEGLTMEIPGALSRRSVNHHFQFSEGNFRQGAAIIQLEENTLKSGTHELIISAQDLLGNVSKQSVTLEITDPADIKLDHVINVPNPVRMGRETRFFFHHSNTPGDHNLNVTIRVYSLGGRLLTVIRNPRNGEVWVPRDQRGNFLTPNVYLYQITASSPNIGKTVKSKIKKLVVHPPR